MGYILVWIVHQIYMLRSLNTIHFHFMLSFKGCQLQNHISMSHSTAVGWVSRAHEILIVTTLGVCVKQLLVSYVDGEPYHG